MRLALSRDRATGSRDTGIMDKGRDWDRTAGKQEALALVKGAVTGNWTFAPSDGMWIGWMNGSMADWMGGQTKRI